MLLLVCFDSEPVDEVGGRLFFFLVVRLDRFASSGRTQSFWSTRCLHVV